MRTRNRQGEVWIEGTDRIATCCEYSPHNALGAERQQQTHHEFRNHPPTLHHPLRRGERKAQRLPRSRTTVNTLPEKSNSFGMYANANIRGEAARRSPRRELSARPPPQYYERVIRERTLTMHMLARPFKPQENGSWRQRRFS